VLPRAADDDPVLHGRGNLAGGEPNKYRGGFGDPYPAKKLTASGGVSRPRPFRSREYPDSRTRDPCRTR
jgi:hypothetical protein